MKKNGPKIIPFPDLEKRLVDKGLEQLQEKKFTAAIQMFEEAKELASDDSNVYMGLVLAYYESGALEKAKDLAKIMLKEGIGEYFQTLDLYMMILVQLHDYEEIVTTIEALDDEQAIPFEKREHFSNFLTFSKRMVENRLSSLESEDEPEYVPHRPLDLLENNDSNLQMRKIVELSQKNIRPYIKEIKAYLQSKEGHPFLKTMLINILQEQEYEKEVIVAKFGDEKHIVPTALPSLHDFKQFLEIKEKVEDLEGKDPTFFHQLISLVERHLYLLYPFELKPSSPAVWAAAYHVTVLEYHGREASIRGIAELYQTLPEEVEKAVSFITKLEEISYPNL